MAEFDTTNATATADDILNGKTAFVQGEKIKGTIQSKLGGTFMPSTEPKVICPAGVYASSAFSVKGDANLKSSNIKKDVKIFGVVGSMQGNDTPSGTLPDNMRTIGVETNNPDGGTVQGGGAALEGMTVTVSATPKGKFKCFGWEENGETVSEDAEYTFKVEKSRNLKALFSDTHKPLPDGYTEVKWIQNLNTSSYIELKNSSVVRFNIGVSFPKGKGTNYEAVYASGGKVYTLSTQSNVYFYSYPVSSGGFTGKTVSSGTSENGIDDISVTGRVTSTNINSTVKINGASTTFTNVSLSESSVVLPTSVSSSSQIVRYHYINGSNTSTKYAFTMIPCINPEGVAGLYDIDNNDFIAPTKGRFITIYDGNFYTIAVSSESNKEWGTVYGGGDYEEGASVTITAEPSEGFMFVGWKENGEIVSNSPTYTFTANADRNLVAEFAVRPSYTISVNIQPDESGEVSGDGRYYENETVTLTATPNDMYKFSEWKENDVQVSTSNPYTFHAESNRKLVAEFVNKLPKEYTQVEYIQSDGKSNIFTGVVPTSSIKIYMDVETLSQNASTVYPQYFFHSGYYPASSNATKNTIDIQWQNKIIAAHIGSYTSTPSSTTLSTNVTPRRMSIGMVASTRTVSIDGTSMTCAGNSTFNTNMVGIRLLSDYIGSYGLPAKLYSCQIYKGSTLIKDFIPCINQSGVAGLYDSVEDTFYQSYSSTAFTAGPVI